MADESGPSLLPKISALIGRFRRWFVPIGLFSLVALGIHAGSDRVDDHVFLLYNRLDAIADQFWAFIIRTLFGLVGVSDANTDRWVYGAAALIDLERKEWLARATALCVELFADLILAIPVFVTRRESHSLQRIVQHLRRDPTILRIVGPLAALLACLSGVMNVARELQVLTFSGLGRLPAGVAGYLASLVGLFALLIVSMRLAFPVVMAAARWADLRAEQDVMDNLSTRARRMRGWLTALIALPVSLLAVFEATPIWGTLRALFPG